MKCRTLMLRKLWLKVHLYLGLTAGVILVLLGLTGSIIVFWQELDAWLNPDLLTTQGAGEYRPLNEISAAGRAALPNTMGDAFYLLAPQGPQEVIHVNYFTTRAQDGTLRDRFIQIFVDPYTGEVLGSRDGDRNLIRVIHDLHRSLLLGGAGETIVGIVGLLLLISITTGIYLWWPQPGKIRQAFMIRRGAEFARLNLDIHNTTGIYSAVVLLVIGLSGVYMVFPHYVQPAVNVFSLISKAPENLQSAPRPGAKPIPPAQALTIAQGVFPGAELKWMDVPLKARGVYLINLRLPGEVTKSFGSNHVYIDQYSGEVLASVGARNLSAGETFLQWQFPLHNGEAFGLIGRLIVFFSGFVPLVLFITGLLIWLKKRRASSASRAKRGRWQMTSWAQEPGATEHRGR